MTLRLSLHKEKYQPMYFLIWILFLQGAVCSSAVGNFFEHLIHKETNATVSDQVLTEGGPNNTSDAGGESQANWTSVQPLSQPASDLSSTAAQQHHERTPCRHCQGKLNRIENEVKSKTDGLDRVGDELRNIDRGMGHFTQTLNSINSHVLRLELAGVIIFLVRVFGPLVSDLAATLMG